MKRAVVYMNKLFEENNLITSETLSTISYESMLIEEEMYKNSLQMMAEKQLITDEELIAIHETDEENFFRELEDSDGSDDFESEKK